MGHLERSHIYPTRYRQAWHGVWRWGWSPKPNWCSILSWSILYLSPRIRRPNLVYSHAEIFGCMGFILNLLVESLMSVNLEIYESYQNTPIQSLLTSLLYSAVDSTIDPAKKIAFTSHILFIFYVLWNLNKIDQHQRIG